MTAQVEPGASPRPQLHLGPGFVIDANLATRRAILLGQPDVGKTSALTRIAEEFLKLQVCICILDWKGDLRGIRSSADGLREGYAVVIFGGDYADIAIEPRDGYEIGTLLAGDELSALVDLSGFATDRARRMFATAFLDAFFAAKRRSRTPHALLIDEYQKYAPERPRRASRAEEAEGSAPSQLLAATENIVGLGRRRGIGVIGTAQRAAQVNKNVVELSDIYFFMQIAGRNDIATIVDTIKPEPDDLQTLRAGLPRLKTGEVFVYSPSWLRVLEKQRFGPRETFDSSRTPEVGVAVTVPTSFAPIDIPALRDRIAATREQRQDADPQALRARIAELESTAPCLADADRAELDALRVAVTDLQEALRVSHHAQSRDRERLAAVQRALVHATQHVAAMLEGADALPRTPAILESVVSDGVAPMPRLDLPGADPKTSGRSARCRHSVAIRTFVTAGVTAG